LNVDGCRVPIDADADASQLRTMQRGQRIDDTNGQTWGLSKLAADEPQVVRPDGRWPANLIHDGSDEVLALFPESDGCQPHAVNSRNEQYDGWGTITNKHGETIGYEGAGSAARFFYTAKADKQDRLGSKHPTVKPVDLMRYLVRLITPPGGRVLDPFAGSGTTGMAALAEGFDCTLIEREAEAVADCRRRVAHVRGDDTPLFAGPE